MKIVAIGAHPDDIEIGCGGAIAAHVECGDTVTFIVMTGGEKGGAPASVRIKEMHAAAKVLGVQKTFCLKYPDTKIPTTSKPLEELDTIIARLKPDRAYIPHWREIHQDHRRTSKIALSACRNVPQVLMYEGPSTFPDFNPTYWINIEKTIEKKIKALGCHESQGHKEILKIEAIRGLNKFRGYQTRTMCAEGFEIFRFVENA